MRAFVREPTNELWAGVLQRNNMTAITLSHDHAIDVGTFNTGVAALASNCPNLTTAGVGGCHISDTGAIALAPPVLLALPPPQPPYQP